MKFFNEVLEYLLKLPYDIKNNQLLITTFPVLASEDMVHALYQIYSAKMYLQQWRYFNYLLRFQAYEFALHWATGTESDALYYFVSVKLRD